VIRAAHAASAFMHAASQSPLRLKARYISKPLRLKARPAAGFFIGPPRRSCAGRTDSGVQTLLANPALASHNEADLR
jgi:hypothetical protein